MADKTVRLNKSEPWICAGTSDVLTCHILSNLRRGVQIDMQGADLSGAVITMHTASGASKVFDIPIEAEEIVLVGEGFVMNKITVTNLAAGTYEVEITI